MCFLLKIFYKKKSVRNFSKSFFSFQFWTTISCPFSENGKKFWFKTVIFFSVSESLKAKNKSFFCYWLFLSYFLTKMNKKIPKFKSANRKKKFKMRLFIIRTLHRYLKKTQNIMVSWKHFKKSANRFLLTENRIYYGKRPLKNVKKNSNHYGLMETFSAKVQIVFC